MKKELIAYIETSEKGEEIRVSRVNDGTNKYILLTLGTNRMVLDVAELQEAIYAIGFYSTMFDEEQKRNAEKLKPKPAGLPAQEDTEEEEGLVLDAPLRLGPTASELALEKQMGLMRGEALVLREEK